MKHVKAVTKAQMPAKAVLSSNPIKAYLMMKKGSAD